MFTKRFSLFAAMFFILTSLSYAQSNKWSIAFMSSYFGDQARSSYQVTAIDKPVSLGIQLQYFLRGDLALQYSAESMNGKTHGSAGDELNVQSALALVAYPIEFGRFRPYLMQSFMWGKQSNTIAAATKTSLYYEFGLGTEFVLAGNMFTSIAAKLYSDGRNYHGWSTSITFGYRL